MKSDFIAWIVLFLLAYGSIYAMSRQIPEKEVPSPVLERFHASYPDAKEVRFELEKDSNTKKEYEVHFMLNGKRQKTEYEFDGVGVVEDRDD